MTEIPNHYFSPKNSNNRAYAGEKYYYVGESDEYFTQGEQYTVIETGIHWYKDWGDVAWMTSDDCPNTTDIDYGVAVDIDSFGKGKDFVKY